MSVTGLEWSAVGFFLVALILFRQCDKAIKADSVDGYRRLAGGLAILSLTALARLYQGIGMFQQVPFLSETLFFDLIYWVLVIAGGAMITSGAAHWLPLARQNRQTSQVKIARLDLLRRIEQLIGFENRLDLVLTHALQYMREAFDIGPGMVCKCSGDYRLIRVVSASPDFMGNTKSIEQALGARVKARHAAGKTVDPIRFFADCLAQEQGKPAVFIPIEVAGRVVGMFAFWGQERQEIDPDVRLILRLAADIIARKVETDSLNLRVRRHEERTAWQERARIAVEEAPATRLKFAALSREISERFPVETVSLSILPSGGRMSRFTWANGRTLIERRLPVVSIDSLTGPAFHAGQTMLYPGLSEDELSGCDSIQTPGVTRSLAAIPFRAVDDVVAVLTLTSERKSALDEGDIAEIRQLSPLIAMLAVPDFMQESQNRENCRMERLAHALNSAGPEDSRQLVLSALASLVADEYGADLLRLSQVDETGMFLESEILVSAGTLQCPVPAHGRIILSLAPMHQRALETRQPIVTSIADGGMRLSNIETTQVLADGIRQALIVPVVRNGKSVGMMTLGSVDRQLIGVGESGGLAFAEVAAAVAARHLTAESADLSSMSHDAPSWQRLRAAPLRNDHVSDRGVQTPVSSRRSADIFS